MTVRVAATTTRTTTTPSRVAVPEPLRDPLTGGLIQRAMRAADGRAYGEASLRDYLANHHGVLPTGVGAAAPLPVADYNLREQVDAFEAGEWTLDDEPTWMVDPVSMELFADPVVASDGRTYDRATLAELVQRDARSPFTRQPLDARVVSNETVRAERHLDPVAPADAVQQLSIGLAASLEAPESFFGMDAGIATRAGTFGFGLAAVPGFVVGGFVGAAAGGILGAVAGIPDLVMGDTDRAAETMGMMAAGGLMGGGALGAGATGAVGGLAGYLVGGAAELLYNGAH